MEQGQRQELQLSDNLADAIGEVVIDLISESSLLSTEFEQDDDGLQLYFLWSANAAEQIGQAVRERFRVSPRKS